MGWGKNYPSTQTLKDTMVIKAWLRFSVARCPNLTPRYLIHIAVSVGLVWESAKSGVQHIRDVVNYCIGTTLDLSEVGVIIILI